MVTKPLHEHVRAWLGRSATARVMVPAEVLAAITRETRARDVDLIEHDGDSIVLNGGEIRLTVEACRRIALAVKEWKL